MKTIKLFATLFILTLSFASIAQSKQETGSAMFPWTDSQKEITAFYGMKIYVKDNTEYLFITDAIKLCNGVEKSDSFKFNQDFEAYIEANYASTIKGANKFVNYGGLSGFTHMCYFFNKKNDTASENYSDAKRGITNAMAVFNNTNHNNREKKIIKISRLDFDFNLPCY